MDAHHVPTDISRPGQWPGEKHRSFNWETYRFETSEGPFIGFPHDADALVAMEPSLVDALKKYGHEKPAEKEKEKAAPEAETDEQTDREDDKDNYVHGLALVLDALAIALAVFLASVDVNIISTAIPHITAEFNSLDDMGWYGSAFLMTTCAFQVLSGRLYADYSPKYVFMASIGIFEIGSLIAALAPSSSVFIVARAVQGIGGCGILAGALNIGSLIVPVSKRAILIALIGAMECIPMISAPLLGGVLTQHLSWRWCFWINLPIGGVVMVLVFFILKVPQPVVQPTQPVQPELGPSEKPTRKKRFLQWAVHMDLVGMSILLAGVVALLIALQWGGSREGWTSLGIIGLFLLTLVLFGIFGYLQHRRQDASMVPPRIIKKRSILGGAWFLLCTASAVTVMSYYLPFWFQNVLGLSPTESGLRLIPMLVGLILAILVGGALVPIVGYYVPFMLAGTLGMSAGAGLLSTLDPKTSNVWLIVYPAVFGIGAGLGFQQPMVAAQTILKGGDVPLGNAILVFGQSLGGAVILAIAESIFSNQLRDNLKALGLPGDASTGFKAEGSSSPVQTLAEQTGIAPDVILLKVNDSITQAMYVGVAMAALSLFGALSMEWVNVRGDKEETKEGAPVEPSNEAGGIDKTSGRQS